MLLSNLRNDRVTRKYELCLFLLFSTVFLQILKKKIQRNFEIINWKGTVFHLKRIIKIVSLEGVKGNHVYVR